MKKIYILLYIYIIILTTTNLLLASWPSEICYEKDPRLFPGLIYDALYLNLDLISTDSLKILALFAPAYFAARYGDKKIHHCFYCPIHHKNQNQLSHHYHTAADKAGIIIPVGLSLLTIAPVREDLQLTARVFTAGLLPLWGLKNIFKWAHHEGCIRPKCEYFDKYNDYYGGCPSGHLAFLAYATTLFGLQEGKYWGIPLGIASATVFGISINGNRHYLSQLIAGTGLGVLYGVAASKVIDTYHKTSFTCDICIEKDRGIGFSLSCSF